MHNGTLGHGPSAPSVSLPSSFSCSSQLLSSILLCKWPSLRCLICLWLSTSVVDGNSDGYRLNPHQDQTWAHTATKQAWLPEPGVVGGDYTDQISPVASHHPWGEFKLPKRQRKPPWWDSCLHPTPSLSCSFTGTLGRLPPAASQSRRDPTQFLAHVIGNVPHQQ